MIFYMAYICDLETIKLKIRRVHSLQYVLLLVLLVSLVGISVVFALQLE